MKEKETIIIIAVVLLMFLVSYILRTKFKQNYKVTFWFSIICMVGFVGIFLKEVIMKKSIEESMISFILLLPVIIYLGIKAFNSYRRI